MNSYEILNRAYPFVNGETRQQIFTSAIDGLFNGYFCASLKHYQSSQEPDFASTSGGWRMKDLIEWLRRMEELASHVYQKAAEQFGVVLLKKPFAIEHVFQSVQKIIS